MTSNVFDEHPVLTVVVAGVLLVLVIAIVLVLVNEAAHFFRRIV